MTTRRGADQKDSMICMLDLSIKNEKEISYWIKRGVAMFTQLNN